MKKLVLNTLLLIACHLAFNQQQPPEIKRSNEKVILDGKVYYIHVVQPGQTAFSISRAYNVTVQDIAAENPGIVLEHLQPGQQLKIPEAGAANQLKSKYFGLDDRDFIYYEVKQGQTVYYISKKYNVGVDVIHAFNPGSESGIRTGQIIRVPRKKAMKEATRAAQDSGRYIYYEVKKKDTLYSLAVRYGVTVADIVGHNPELRWGLKTGQIIKIPRTSDLFTEAIKAGEDTVHADTLIQMYTVSKCDSIRHTLRNKKMNVALILPFYADMTMHEKRIFEDTLTIPDDTNYTGQARRQTRIRGGSYFEFYQGILIALDTLKNGGFDIALHVYDTERDTNRTKRIVNRLETEMPDLIIGPVFPDDIKLVKKFAEKNNILIISPLYNRPEQLADYLGIFQIVPSRETEYRALHHFITKNRSDNILLIYDGDTLNNKDLLVFIRNLSVELSTDTVTHRPFIKILPLNDTIMSSLYHTLAADRENLVIVASNNEAFASVVLSKLTDYSLKSYDITVLGQSAWLSFKNIDIEYLHQLNTTIYTPFYIDLSDRRTLNFLHTFTSYYGQEPLEVKLKGYNLAYLGYDILFYFAKAYAMFGDECIYCLNHVSVTCLMSRYHFVQDQPGGGFENSDIIFVRFNEKDYSVTKLGADSAKDKQ